MRPAVPVASQHSSAMIWVGSCVVIQHVFWNSTFTSWLDDLETLYSAVFCDARCKAAAAEGRFFPVSWIKTRDSLPPIAQSRRRRSLRAGATRGRGRCFSSHRLRPLLDSTLLTFHFGSCWASCCQIKTKCIIPQPGITNCVRGGNNPFTVNFKQRVPSVLSGWWRSAEGIWSALTADKHNRLTGNNNRKSS